MARPTLLGAERAISRLAIRHALDCCVFPILAAAPTCTHIGESSNALSRGRSAIDRRPPDTNAMATASTAPRNGPPEIP